MKNRFKQIWEEHKSRDKKPEAGREDDIAKALEKMINILSKSHNLELLEENQNLNLIKKRIWEEISKQHKKKKEIDDINKKIKQSKDHKAIFALKEKLQILKTPEPLEPLEMVNALLSLPKHPRYKIPILKNLLKRIDSLEETQELYPEELIYVSGELAITSLVTPLKHKIDLRKKFLEKTTQSLSIVTELPNKPGDLDNISGVVKILQESFKDVFNHNQELYRYQIELLGESLQLLLRVRGELKAWADVDKFVKEYKITDGQILRMVHNAKSPDGGGIFNFLGGQDLNNLIKLLNKVEFLTQTHRLFYKTIINPSKADNLILKLKNYKTDLGYQIKFSFESFLSKRILLESDGNSGDHIIGQEYLRTLQLVIEVIDSIFNTEESSGRKIFLVHYEISLVDIILEYLGIDNIIINANKYYKEQLHYTNIAIKWINGLQISKKGQIKKYFHYKEDRNVGVAIKLLDENQVPNNKPISKLKSNSTDYTGLSSFITKHLKQDHIVNIILEYVTTERIGKAGVEYLNYLKQHHLKEKLSLLNETKQILYFFEQVFLTKNIQHFQKILQILDLIELDSYSSDFLKIIDLREKSNLEFIQKTIDPIIYLISFFDFENMLSLNSDNKLVYREITKIENYLTEQVGPMIKTIVQSTISKESELLDNFSYLMRDKSSKKLNPFSLLDLLIRLTKYGNLNTQNLLHVNGLDKLVMFEFINPILVDDNDKFFLLFYLIDSGYGNIEMVNKLSKIKIDINASHNGRTLLDSIAYQLTKVGRPTDFSLVPKKYTINPEKQDQLLDIALNLIHNGANINSDSGHTRGFLTTLFSIIPREQSPYLYKKLLSNKEISSRLDLLEVDIFQRNLAHLFCKDVLEIFYSFTNPQVAKTQVGSILTKIISSKNSHHLNKQDKEGNTPWHYLASSISSDFVNINTDFSLEKIKKVCDLSIQNRYGDTPLHTAFTEPGNPAAFYEFVLTDICPPTQWLKSPKLGLKIKNNQKQTVLAMIIHTNSKLAASAINTYMAVVNYKIDLDDGCTFETIRSKVDTFLKGIPQIPADEIGRTKYLGEKYDSTRCDSHSSCSSVSSSPSSSMPHSFPPSFSYYLLIQGDSGITDRGRTDTEYDCYSKSSLMGDNSDFTLHS